MKIVGLLTLGGGAILATGCAKSPSPSVIEAQGSAWAEALASRDAERIVDLYDDDAVLLATFQSRLQGEDAIQEYFEGLTKNEGLSVRFEEQNTRALGRRHASNSGTYTFSYLKDGQTVEVPARYTFVYKRDGDDWEIVEHHSSTRPE